MADDKIKVLYVEHPPRFEYRYLKNSLVRDPKILAHCILTSADPEFSQESIAIGIEFRSRPVARKLFTGEANRTCGRLQHHAPWGLQRNEHVPSIQLRITHDGGDIVHRSTGNAGCRQD